MQAREKTYVFIQAQVIIIIPPMQKITHAQADLMKLSKLCGLKIKKEKIEHVKNTDF